MKKLLLLLVAVFLIFVGIWFFFIRDNKPETEPQTDKSIPSAYDPSVPMAASVEYKFKFGSNLSFKYPQNWQLAEGEDNADSAQIVTLESPKDDNGHYYCLNFDEFNSANKADLNLTGVKIAKADNFMAEGIGKDLQQVIYAPISRVSGERAPWRLTLIDMPTTVDAAGFSGQITNPGGRRLQVTGRFDCREENPALTTLEQFENAHWHKLAVNVLVSLKF